MPQSISKAILEKRAAAVAFGRSDDEKTAMESILAMYSDPLKFELYQAGVLVLVANDRSMLHYETGLADNDGKISQQNANPAKITTSSDDERHGGKTVVDYGEDGMN